MSGNLRKNFARLLFAGVMAVPAMEASAVVSDLFIFGDSLADTGIVFTLSGGTVPPSPPSFNGRFSNGPVWVETLAAELGFPTASNPFFTPGGHNFAIGGARTGADGSAGAGTGILGQIFGLYQPAYGTSAMGTSALFVLEAGGNDLRDIALLTDPVAAANAAIAAAGNMVFAAKTLHDLGASKILVANAPNVGLAPEAAGRTGTGVNQNPDYVAAALTAQTIYNNALAAGLAALEAGIPGLGIISFDLAGVLQAVGDDALNGGAQYGLTGTTGFCFLQPPGPTDCAHSIFWDDLHPTAAVHAIIGEAAAAAVPVPATLLLIWIGLLGFAARHRRTT